MCHDPLQVKDLADAVRFPEILRYKSSASCPAAAAPEAGGRWKERVFSNNS